MLSAVLLTIFPFAMIYAASSDLVSMTIANRVSLGLIAGFVLVAALSGMALPMIGLHLAVGFGCLAVTFTLFAMGWIGGGDAKLLAATAVWFGPTLDLANYVLLGAVYGGLLTVGLLVTRVFFVPVTGVDFIDRLLEPTTGVPYGIALGAAGLTVYSESAWMTLALTALGS